MKTLRVGVIGRGMGKAHIRGFRGVEGVEVAALADMNEARLAAQGKEHGIAALYTERRGDAAEGSARHRQRALYNTRPVAWSLPPLSAMRHFVDSLRANTPHTATGQEGGTMMRILDAIYLSAAKGEPVRMA